MKSVLTLKTPVLQDDTSTICLVIAACAVHKIWRVGAEMFAVHLRAVWQQDRAGWSLSKALPSPVESCSG